MTAIDQTVSETDHASYRRGLFLVILAGFIWSSQGVAVKFMNDADAWQILFYRSLSLAIFLLVVIAIRSGGKPFAAFRALGSGAVLGGICLVFAFSGSIVAVKETTVANAFFLFAAAPFLAALLGKLLLGENIRRATWIAMTVALFGIVVMVAGQLGSGRLLGNIAALASALGFAVFTIVLRWKRLGDTMPIICCGGLFAAIVGGVACLYSGVGFELAPLDLSISLALGVGQLGLGLVVYTIGSRYVPASELALLAMFEVVLAPIWTYLALGETMSLQTAIGGALILGAIAVNALSGMRKRPPPVVP